MQIASSKYRLYYFLSLYVGVFAILALIGYYVAGKTGMVNNHHEAPQKFATDLTYYDLPRMTVILNSGNKGPHVRLDISLEVAKKDLKLVEGYKPHMVERLNSFFVTVDPERMQQAMYMPWLHNEMLKQINSVGAPAPVHDVFLRQMLIM